MSQIRLSQGHLHSFNSAANQKTEHYLTSCPNNLAHRDVHFSLQPLKGDNKK